MEEWGWNPNSLGAIGTLVGAMSVIFAVMGLGFAYRQTRIAHEQSQTAYLQNRRARNLQAVLSISSDLRQRWEGGWDSILRKQVPNMNLEQRWEGDVGKQLTYMLNWLDWMGLIVKNDWIDKDLIFGSTSSVVKEIIMESADRIDKDMQEKGSDWWGNVLFLAMQPEINVDIADQAESLRQKWRVAE